jgi:hypothetical protein
MEQANLGPYPILQFAAAILVLVGVGLAVYRGFRDKSKALDANDPSSRWFFDGPIKVHLEQQAEIVQQQAEIMQHIKALREASDRLEREKAGEESRKHTDLLQRLVIVLERRR